jgi:hypothetical protein
MTQTPRVVVATPSRTGACTASATPDQTGATSTAAPVAILALNVVVVVMVERVTYETGNGRRQRRAANAGAIRHGTKQTARKAMGANHARRRRSAQDGTSWAATIRKRDNAAKRKRGRIRCKRDKRRGVIVVAGNGPARMVAGRNGENNGAGRADNGAGNGRTLKGHGFKG